MSRLFARLVYHLGTYLVLNVASARAPDFIVGRPASPYLMRWYLVPWRVWGSLEHLDVRKRWHRYLIASPRLRAFFYALPAAYLHLFLRDDDDRALHDHPWAWCSVLLFGSYTEVTIDAGGIVRRSYRTAPSVKLSWARRAHRVELPERSIYSGHRRVPCYTLFFTGFRTRDWGFHCPDAGWIHHLKFTDPKDSGQTGRGCE